MRRRGRDASPSRHHTHRLARLLAALLLLVLAVPPAVVSAEGEYLNLKVSAQRLEIGQEVTLTATLTDSEGNEVVGKPIKFKIEGANPGEPAPVNTNDQGQATYTYTGEKVGKDTITAEFTPDEGYPIKSNPVTVTWFRVSELTLTPSALFGIAGEEVTLTATVRANDGGSAEGA